MSTRSASKATRQTQSSASSSQGTIVTTVVQSSSAVTSTPVRARSPSPIRMSRQQEKEELGSLNDRLAAIIDRNRHLELENTRLTTQIQEFNESSKRDMTAVHELYGKEIEDLRKALDANSNALAQHKIDNGRMRAELEEARTRLAREEADKNSALTRATAAERELEARIKQRDSLLAQLEKVQVELSNLRPQYEAVRHQLEAETLKRAEVENQLQTVKEQLTFAQNLHRTEIERTITATNVRLLESSTSIQRDYDGRLNDALRDNRDQTSREVLAAREESQRLLESRLEAMRQASEGSQAQLNTIRNELNIAIKQVDTLRGQLTRSEAENTANARRVGELELQLQKERDLHQSDIDGLQREIKLLREHLETQMREYDELMGVKVELDQEIATYRLLLEAEETRLNLTPAIDEPEASGPSAKRRRIGTTESSQEKRTLDASDFEITNVANGAISFDDIDFNGRFIRLINTGQEEVSLGTWQLRMLSGDASRSNSPVTLFKVPRGTSLASNTTLTVWTDKAAERDKIIADPPHVLIMKIENWNMSSKRVVISLLNNKGEEMATCTLVRRADAGSSSFASVLASPLRLVRPFFGTGSSGVKRSSSGERTIISTRTTRTESSSTVAGSGSQVNGEGEAQGQQCCLM